MQTITPNKDYVFAQPEKAQRKTTSGFTLTEEASYKPEVAVVLTVGEGVSFQSGDRIVYKPYTTTEIKLEDTEYILVNQEDILGVLHETN